MKRVAVIGAGLAGLSCAFSLNRRGLACTVFQPQPQQARHTAASYLLAPDLFRNTFQLIHDLGLTREVIPISPYAGQVYKGRIYTHRVASATGLLKFKGLHIVDKALLPRMAYLLARHASRLDFHKPERGLEFDNETAASYVKRELSQNVLNYVAGPLISTLFFYGSDETSAWLCLILTKHMHDVRMSTVRGGISRIADALSKDLHVVSAEPVRRLDTDGASFVVRGERFSDVVVAVPGDAVLAIDGIPDLLSENDRRFFQDVRYQRVVSVKVATERPSDGHCYAVSIPRVENFSAQAISFHDYIDPSTVPNGEGLLTITGGGPAVTPETLVGDLKKLYPLAPVDPVSIEAFEWNSGMPKFPPGRYREISEFQQRQRRPGLFFCGDYLLGPLMEGAITTGLRAAGAIQT